MLNRRDPFVFIEKVFPYFFFPIFVAAFIAMLTVWGFVGYTLFTEGVDGLMPTIHIVTQ